MEIRRIHDPFVLVDIAAFHAHLFLDQHIASDQSVCDHDDFRQGMRPWTFFRIVAPFIITARITGSMTCVGA
jgi:hypothetical protein